ncbi:MAG: hypothetical protein ACK6A7_18635, partial [Planctomycetota bacterium]
GSGTLPTQCSNHNGAQGKSTKKRFHKTRSFAMGKPLCGKLPTRFTYSRLDESISIFTIPAKGAVKWGRTSLANRGGCHGVIRPRMLWVAAFELLFDFAVPILPEPG